MPECSSHKKELFGQTNMKVVAEAIGDLHYETMSELLNALAAKLWHDYEKDNEAGREELARCLLWTYYGVHKASHGAERAWQISKPFMKQ